MAGAKDDVIVATERAGWLDLYNKKGEFLPRIQSGLRDSRGFVVVSADGGTLAARSVAPLPDGTGFAIGLTDGTVARLSGDGTGRTELHCRRG